MLPPNEQLSALAGRLAQTPIDEVQLEDVVMLQREVVVSLRVLQERVSNLEARGG